MSGLGKPEDNVCVRKTIHVTQLILVDNFAPVVEDYLSHVAMASHPPFNGFGFLHGYYIFFDAFTFFGFLHKKFDKIQHFILGP